FAAAGSPLAELIRSIQFNDRIDGLSFRSVDIVRPTDELPRFSGIVFGAAEAGFTPCGHVGHSVLARLSFRRHLVYSLHDNAPPRLGGNAAKAITGRRS